MTAVLQRLEFTDFQSLKSTTIDLDPALTVLVGRSNLGKSAALRAVKALAKNAPATGLVREGAKQLQVTAIFSDGQTESLIKGKNKSEFVLNDQNYPKAGAYDVPDEIAQLWQVSDLSFTSQHDPPFLLADSPATVAKTLGDLTNASLLVRAIGEANKLRTQALSDQKAREREAEEVREELLGHAGLVAREKATNNARERYATATEVVRRYEALSRLKQRIEALKAEDVALQSVNIPIAEIEKHFGIYDKEYSRISNLTRLKQRATLLRNEIEAVQTVDIPVNELENLLGACTTACEFVTELDTLNVRARAISTAEGKLKAAEKLAVDNLTTLEKQLHDAMGDTCPMCGQEIQ